MKLHSENFVKYVAAVVKPGDRVLDLGCASASLWGLFKTYLDDSVALVGVDISTKMLEEAKKDFPKGDFRVGSMMNIPAESGAFDIVIVSSAFHHLPDSALPAVLDEISRVMDEHGTLVGREPLIKGRVGDRGGWVAGSLMALRHMVYRLTHTREYPEPDPGPDHHAYDPKMFLELIDKRLKVIRVDFKNPVSLFFSRVQHPVIAKIATLLDEVVGHKEGQEVCYVASKNFYTSSDVKNIIDNALEENNIKNMPQFLAYLSEANIAISHLLDESSKNSK
jgi:ubiquinone/menaquinone biosynthesis C-methylase UbiE